MCLGGVVSVLLVFGLAIVAGRESTRYQDDDGVQSTQDRWIYSTSTSLPPKSQVSEESGASRNDERVVRPIDKGLQPLYVMVREFLNLVHPDSKADWIDDPRFEHVFDDGDAVAGLTVIYESLSDWRFWSSHYIGFTVCIVVGALFVIVMPIVGLCLCCCRMRGRCGAKRRKRSEKSDGCRRGACGIVLIVFTTLVAAGMVCAFLTNELMHHQTSAVGSNSRPISATPSSGSTSDGVLSTVIASLRRIEAYRSRTFGELRTDVLSPIAEQIQIIGKQLLDFPDAAREKLLTLTDSRPILLSAEALASSLEEISSNVGLVQEYVERLVRLQTQLSQMLSQVKRNVLNALPDGCPLVEECRRLRDQVNRLNLTADFSQGQNLSNQLTVIRSVIDNDFRKMIDEGRIQYQNTSERILNEARDAIRDFNKRIEEVMNDATNLIEELNSETSDSLPINSTVNVLQRTVVPKVKEYGDYRYYIGIALSCVLMMLVLFTCIGLCFGLCGEAPGDDARTCNRGVGASFLMAGVGFTFLFGWLLMAVVIALFVVGGASYTEVCRPALLQENKAFMKVGERLLASQLNKTKLRFTIKTLLSNCKDDEGIFEAFNLEDATNLTGHFENLRNVVRSSVGSLRDQIRPNLSDVIIAPREVFDALNELKNANIDDIRFASFEELLNQPITNADVSSLADELFEASKSPYLNRNQSQTLVQESQRLRNISSTIISLMINISSSLREVVLRLKTEIEPNPDAETFANRTQDLINALTEMQDFIRTSLSGLISNYILNFIQNICDGAIAFINSLQNQIQRNVGRCRVLYDEFKVITFSVCQSFLSPFNGFWFSFGWCLFFGIPSIIFSVKLIELYRKSDDCYIADSKSLDDPFYDSNADINADDSIPLDDVPHRRRELPYQQGHQNPVYDGTDDLQRSPSSVTGSQSSAPLYRALGDPGFIHPLYSGEISIIRPGHRHPQRNSYSSK